MKTIEELQTAKTKAESDIKNILDSFIKEQGNPNNIEVKCIFEGIVDFNEKYTGIKTNVKIMLGL
jgi:hypothetical protein